MYVAKSGVKGCYKQAGESPANKSTAATSERRCDVGEALCWPERRTINARRSLNWLWTTAYVWFLKTVTDTTVTPATTAYNHAAQPSYILLSLSTLVADPTRAATSSATILVVGPGAAAPPLAATAALRLPVSRAVHLASAAAAKARCLASARCLRLPVPLLLLLLPALPPAAAEGLKRACPAAGVCIACSEVIASATVSAAPAKLSSCSVRCVNSTCACRHQTGQR